MFDNMESSMILYKYIKEKINMSYLKPSRQAEIQRIIDSIPALTSGISYPDNNLIDVATALNAEVIVKNLDDEGIHIDGAMVRNKKNKAKATIFINSQRPDERKLFTLAHEIGHFLLGHNGTNFRIDRDIYSRGKDVYETEANFFAAALLMPEKDVVNFILSGMSADEMAGIFNVSRSAAKNRISWVKKNSVALKGFF